MKNKTTIPQQPKYAQLLLIVLTLVRRIHNSTSCVSIVLVTLIHSFFVKQQYAAITLNRLAIKLSKLLCLESKFTVRVERESNVPPVLYS